MTQNIENITISLIFFLMICGGILAFWIYGINALVSYEVALISFGVVFASLYIAIWSKIKQKVDNTLEIAQERGVDMSEDQDSIESERDQSKYQKFSKNLALGLNLSFSFLRIIAYLGFALAIIGLLELRMFDIWAYMSGVFAGLCGVIVFIFAQMRKKN